MSEDNIHEVVKLLLARMKSHPEEFASGASRWGWMVGDVMDHCSDEERTALKEGLRPIRLQEIHEHVMDELCNGDERRRKEQEEYERDRSMGARLRAAIGPALQRIDEQTYAQQLQQAHQNIYANPQFDPVTQDYVLGNGLRMTKAQVEDNPGMVATIKKALGI